MVHDQSTDDEAIEMYVGGLVLDPNSQAPVVILKDEGGTICLPIWIGVAEATSIASALKQVGMVRPLSHDLMLDVINEFGGNIERVIISDLKDATYYAELVISKGDKIFIFDSRPSDAIALAVRTSSPVYVSKTVLDQAKILVESPDKSQEGEQSNKSELEEDTEIAVKVVAGDDGDVDGDGISSSAEYPKDSDLSGIGKDKWKTILEELDPDDFKYKM
jgi:bifunctional DNase/RNase